MFKADRREGQTNQRRLRLRLYNPCDDLLFEHLSFGEYFSGSPLCH